MNCRAAARMRDLSTTSPPRVHTRIGAARRSHRSRAKTSCERTTRCDAAPKHTHSIRFRRPSCDHRRSSDRSTCSRAAAARVIVEIFSRGFRAFRVIFRARNVVASRDRKIRIDSRFARLPFRLFSRAFVVPFTCALRFFPDTFFTLPFPYSGHDGQRFGVVGGVHLVHRLRWRGGRRLGRTGGRAQQEAEDQRGVGGRQTGAATVQPTAQRQERVPRVQRVLAQTDQRVRGDFQKIRHGQRRILGLGRTEEDDGKAGRPADSSGAQGYDQRGRRGRRRQDQFPRIFVDLPQSVRRFATRGLRPERAGPTDGNQRGRSGRDRRQRVFRGQDRVPRHCQPVRVRAATGDGRKETAGGRKVPEEDRVQRKDRHLPVTRPPYSRKPIVVVLQLHISIPRPSRF